MATVPGNALQDHMRNQQKIIKRPSFGVRGSRRGILVKVYDRDTIEGSEVPGELSKAISMRPGRLYGQVKLISGDTYYLAFALSPEVIYSTYGDSKLIEGRAINVVFYDRNIHLGEIDLIPQDTVALRDTFTTTNVFDIGDILT